MSFNLDKLLRDVFAPQPGERVLVMFDVPHGKIHGDQDWTDRIGMAKEWHAGFKQLGCDVLPLLAYPATGASNADLPAAGDTDGNQASVPDMIARANIVVALTRYSATAPLSAHVKSRPDLRVASMPNVLRRMEQSALAADYSVVGPRTHALAERLTRADAADVVFSSGHKFTFDLRYRTGHADDGMCGPDKQGFRLINLPSGEAFIVPYEGERPGEPSLTHGVIPLSRNGESMLLHVEKNRIVKVEGAGPQCTLFRSFLDTDPARNNVAELGLGCNDKAIVTGNVLEDEKAGYHWAYGRSEHLGGVTGPDAFKSPANVVHHDVVYAPGSPIGILSLTLRYPDGSSERIMDHSKYCIFS
ncbi:MAG TPA: aminopeptidase [Kiritimatiellia bacterium]|jgi:leucyl aminopeptidase (aminopeptidase T)